MNQKPFLFLFFLCIPFLVQSQKRNSYIIAEGGFTIYGNSIIQNNFIRDDMSSSYYESYNSAYVDKQLDNNYVGLKFETRSRSNKFGYIGGIRYTQLNSSITKKGAPEYFYFLYQQTADNTEYFKIKSISEKTTCIGIPIEFRYFPLTFGRGRFRLYATAGIEVGISLSTKNSIDFYEPSMKVHEKEVIDKIRSKNLSYQAFYGGVGISYGKPGTVNVNVGICAPAMLAEDVSSFLKPIAGGGARIQILIPITKAISE